MPHSVPASAYLLIRCLLIGAGTWLLLNGAAVYFLIKDRLLL